MCWAYTTPHIGRDIYDKKICLHPALMYCSFRFQRAMCSLINPLLSHSHADASISLRVCVRPVMERWSTTKSPPHTPSHAILTSSTRHRIIPTTSSGPGLTSASLRLSPFSMRVFVDFCTPINKVDEYAGQIHSSVVSTKHNSLGDSSTSLHSSVARPSNGMHRYAEDSTAEAPILAAKKNKIEENSLDVLIKPVTVAAVPFAVIEIMASQDDDAKGVLIRFVIPIKNLSDVACWSSCYAASLCYFPLKFSRLLEACLGSQMAWR